MSGYIGTQPVPQATQTRDTFTATAGQTSFATSGYTPGYLDVFLNGVHLVNGTDYTASNGSDVVLTSGAASGDTLQVVSYSTYQVNSQNYTGGLTVDNSGATVLTVDRATSDGTIIDVQKNGSSVGAIGNNGNEIFIGSPNGAGAFLRFGGGGFYPATSTGANSDNTTNIGDSAVRFKDLYLSGGVYLGGTGAANLLDDYEEGTWTPSIIATSGGTPGAQTNSGTYRKIGGQVTVWGDINFSRGTLSGVIQISGLPFTASAFARYGASCAANATWGWNADVPRTIYAVNNSTILGLWDDGTSNITEGDANASLGNSLLFTLTYFTAS